MRVLILGASGMLGFALHRALHDGGFEVMGAIRTSQAPASRWCGGLRYAANVDVQDLSRVLAAVAASRADVVVNAIGEKAGAAPTVLLSVNAMFPRLLERELSPDVYMIHFSTDGVFSGSRGMYDETCRPDATDLYGVSKYLGEPASARCLVLRTSLIGRALAGGAGLVDWLVSQSGVVDGYRRSVFSGLPVNEIANLLVERILPQRERLTGVWHLSAEPISKYALLCLLKRVWSLGQVEIAPADIPVLDRSLDSSRLRRRLGYSPPPWGQLVSGMQAYYQALDARPRMETP